MRMIKTFKHWLQHPLTSELDIDDPKTTELRRIIIQEKTILRMIYEEWYKWIVDSFPAGKEPILELGSGAGFLNQLAPKLITSEVFLCPNIQIVLDGHYLPLREHSLRGIVMTDVLHHLSHTPVFFREASRCIKKGGAIIFVEPWCTTWSKMIYTKLHHEPFAPNVKEWDFPSTGALSGANGALPWIIFQRDRSRFEQEFPEWQITSIEPIIPFRYLVSGGVSLRSFMPGWTYPFWMWLERSMKPWSKHLAMFAKIILTKQS